VTDYFEVFGLPRKLSLDLQELQRRFYDLSRRHHPDFHQTADALAQACLSRPRPSSTALIGRSATPSPGRVRDSRSRKGGRSARRPRPSPGRPTDLLAEMLEVQEALQEAKSEGLTAEAAERLRTSGIAGRRAGARRRSR